MRFEKYGVLRCIDFVKLLLEKKDGVYDCDLKFVKNGRVLYVFSYNVSSKKNAVQDAEDLLKLLKKLTGCIFKITDEEIPVHPRDGQKYVKQGWRVIWPIRSWFKRKNCSVVFHPPNKLNFFQGETTVKLIIPELLVASSSEELTPYVRLIASFLKKHVYHPEIFYTGTTSEDEIYRWRVH